MFTGWKLHSHTRLPSSLLMRRMRPWVWGQLHPSTKRSPFGAKLALQVMWFEMVTADAQMRLPVCASSAKRESSKLSVRRIT